MSVRPGTGLLACLHLVLAFSSSSSLRADVPPGSAPKKTEITLAGPAAASAGVKEVVAELLARDGVSVAWQSQPEFHTWDVFGAPSKLNVTAWIDLSAPTEARLYFRDAATDRFYLRALPLLHGADEIAKEEIAHVVSNAVLAARAPAARQAPADRWGQCSPRRRDRQRRCGDCNVCQPRRGLQ